MKHIIKTIKCLLAALGNHIVFSSPIMQRVMNMPVIINQPAPARVNKVELKKS
ncbi:MULTISPECIES: hypothetical protein [Niastella]|uniref:Uncharacterized protein n=1 Tax=Niastella soli TaxID=2821487 RepID=A0ABS3YSA0_9BACT|nr:hypothetical protein [Niastella soli]MBO9200792.1 hypothetical protein [Niastella soli]